MPAARNDLGEADGVEPTRAARRLGRSDVRVSSICLGTSPLGSMPELYGHEVAEETALATLRAAFEGGMTFVDASNNYGRGRSEERIGRAIRQYGGPPEHVVVATKIDPDPDTGAFDRARAFASFEESRARLGMDTLPLLYIHNPEKIPFEEAMGPAGPVGALIELKESGQVASIGVAGGPIDLMIRYLGTDVFDVVLTHNRYTLLDRSAAPLLREARRRDIGTVNAAPYAGGILAKGADRHPRYMYRDAQDSVRRRVRALEELCAAFAVPLPAVALQFSLRAADVDSTVVGASAPERIHTTTALARVPIPDDLWQALREIHIEEDSHD